MRDETKGAILDYVLIAVAITLFIWGAALVLVAIAGFSRGCHLERKAPCFPAALERPTEGREVMRNSDGSVSAHVERPRSERSTPAGATLLASDEISTRRKARRSGTTTCNSTSPDRLTPQALALLRSLEAAVGPVKLVSTHRCNAVIAGTGGSPSLHRYGCAFDFETGRKGEAVRWLRANAPGSTITYRNSRHVHADIGRRKCGRRV